MLRPPNHPDRRFEHPAELLEEAWQVIGGERDHPAPWQRFARFTEVALRAALTRYRSRTPEELRHECDLWDRSPYAVWANDLHVEAMRLDPEWCEAFARQEVYDRRQQLIRSGLSLTGVRDVDRLAGHDVEMTPALDIVDEWMNQGEPATVLHLWGGCDSGKTFAAGWAVVNAMFPANDDDPEQPAPISLRPDALARLFRPDRYKDDPAVERVRRAELFVLDDLGTETLEWFSDVLLETLEARQGSTGTLTLITSNVAPHKLEERYGARVASRAALWRHEPCRRLGMRGSLPKPRLRGVK